MRVLSVVGTRPQLVKAAAISRVLAGRHDEVLLHTRQHVDAALSEDISADLGLRAPDEVLEFASWEPATRLAAMVRGLDETMRRIAPEVVLVHGDTDTTLAAALAARECGLPLAHLEAGLRSGDLTMPEERNRIVTDHLSELLLCPTTRAVETLKSERARGRIEQTGDVMLDVCLQRAVADDGRSELEGRGLTARGFVLATVHRARNTDDPARLRAVLDGLAGSRLPVVLALHPRTRAALERDDLELRRPVQATEPLVHGAALALARHAACVVTDSGGLQKEAYFLGTPCLTLRDVTEWPETLRRGWNCLVPDGGAELADALAAIERPETQPELAAFGGGRAAEAAVEALERLVATRS